MALPTGFSVPLAGAAVAVLLSGPACVDIIAGDLGKFVDRQEKRFPTNGKPDVDLSTFDGAIEIRSWNRPEVLVVIEKRGRDKAETDTIEVNAEQNGNRVTVDARVPYGTAGWGISWHDSWRSARLIVSLPPASNILASSGDGSIDIERVSGTIDLRSGDGSIHARDLTGDLKAHTGDGSIKLTDVDGSLDIDTGDGSVVVSGKLTTVRVRTDDGSVTVQAAPASAAAADWTITTGDGSVTLALPDGFGGELDAHTGDGGIHLQGISVSNTSGRNGKNTFRGTIGSGGRALRLRTGDGSITLRRF
jgi:hypothetical protein